MKKPGPTGWRGVMNQRPQPSEFGLSPLAGDVDSITQRQRVRVSRITHGVGGGMRVNEDADVFRRVEPQDRFGRSRPRVSLTFGRATFGIYAMGLLATLCIGHIALRFHVHDFKVQQHSLQTIQQKLQTQFHNLNQQRGTMSEPQALQDYAVNELGMEPMPENAPTVHVSRYNMERYSEKAIAAENAAREKEVAEAHSSFRRNPFRTLADMALAFADKTH